MNLKFDQGFNEFFSCNLSISTQSNSFFKNLKQLISLHLYNNQNEQYKVTYNTYEYFGAIIIYFIIFLIFQYHNNNMFSLSNNFFGNYKL